MSIKSATPVISRKALSTIFASESATLVAILIGIQAVTIKDRAILAAERPCTRLAPGSGQVEVCVAACAFAFTIDTCFAVAENLVVA